MIEVENLTAGYSEIVVLRSVSLRVREREILGVLGRNGMGKTTLINCLAGLIPVKTGVIRFAGVDISRLESHERARLGMTTVIQGSGIFPNLTVRENLEVGRLASRSTKNRIDEVVGYFPRLGERFPQQAGTLSGGEQRMLAIGRGLMTNPKVMLLDEPSDGVMPVLVKQIAQDLVEINRREGMTIMIVEQNVPMVFDMTDHCIILEKGRVVANGNREELSRVEIMKQYLAI